MTSDTARSSAASDKSSGMSAERSPEASRGTSGLPHTHRVAGAMCGLIAAGVALGVAELVAAFVASQSSPIVAVGGTVIDATPQWLKQFAIAHFGTNDKPVLLGTIVAVLIGLALLTGALAVRRTPIGLGGVALLGIVGAAAAETRPASVGLAFLPSVLGAVAGGFALHVMLRSLRRVGPRVRKATPAVEPRKPGSVADQVHDYLGGIDRKGGGYNRRAFLFTSLGAAAVAGVAGGAGRVAINRRFDVAASRAAVRLPAPASAARTLPRGVDLKLDGLSPFVTSNKEFYRVDTALIVPQLSTADWQLKIHGLVDHPMEIDFPTLLKRDLIERDITLTCVSNEVGGQYVGTARWLGARLADLLKEVGVHKDADQIVSTSIDGMTIGTPTAVVMDGRDAMLAIGMNGQALPAEHGFPVRMVVPGLYGYVSATKWVVDLELTRFADNKPYWVKRGWARKAPIKTMSRIDTPRPLSKVKAGRVAVAGVAWAQHRGVEAVEVRVDGGGWHAARLATVPSIDTWRQWVYEWDASPGQHTIEVRATDRTGTVQPSRRAKPFPSGATGWQSTVVTVA
jgi:DMSO/TMAO reductase YedYZ molybdopterin-dependent catalytic subunit